MKHISKKICLILLIISMLVVQLCGCSSIVYEETDLSVYLDETILDTETGGMAQNLCVTTEDVIPEGMEESITAYAAGLFNVTDQEVMYAKNIFEQVQPASITKLLTALVALKYGDLTDTVTVSQNAMIDEYGATLCGFYVGETLTLEEALYGLLLVSGNDAAVVIAEHIGGSVEDFADMMNAEAKAIGATGTHYVNPHGLTATDHYTTVYDLYLIMNELLQYPKFLEIIQTTSYTYTLTIQVTDATTDADSANAASTATTSSSDASSATGFSTDSTTDSSLTDSATDNSSDAAASGTDSSVSDSTENSTLSDSASVQTTTQEVLWENTNWYFKGQAEAPEGITILGGKTGTTTAAGHCLIILSEDTEGKQYISVVMRAATRETVYKEMTELLNEILN